MISPSALAIAAILDNDRQDVNIVYDYLHWFLDTVVVIDRDHLCDYS